MDTLTLNTLNKYINNYKHDIILKLSNSKNSDKNISSQSELATMIMNLDYSPKKKAPIQFPDKIDLTKIFSKPQFSKMQTKDKIPGSIPKSKEDEISDQKNKETNNQKDENKSRKASEASENNINPNINSSSHTPTDSSNQSVKNNSSFDNVRLIQKHQIRIYVLSKTNFFEIEFSPNETIASLKKRIYTKLEHSVNIVLKHNTSEAYEIRPTKGMNIIYYKPNNKIEKELSPDELKEKCAPDMSKPCFESKALIRDLDNDSLCFVEKKDYVSRISSANIDTESLIDDNKKLYGEYITDTGENQINCKVFIKIGNYTMAKVVPLDSNACLRDVFEKISNSNNITEKNSDYYYFVEHSEENDNENMDEAINPDLEVKFLYPYMLDLYKKKFADVPNVSKKNNIGFNFSEEKNEIMDRKQDYVLNDTTAGVYQEFSVIKINSHNKRQERILGIDLYTLKNEKPKSQGGIFSRKKAKIQERKIKDIQEIKDTGGKTFEIIISSGDQNEKTLKYEAPDINVKNEIIAKLNYIMKMNNI